MRHNPYAEWYFNTIRLDSPAAAHHQETYSNAPYDVFIDQWRAARFDAGALLDLVAQSGARYFIPTTKHHDGVTLWDAPGTASRNTVSRGPKRDLIGELAQATRAVGLKFGVYYSGGMDWHFAKSDPIADRTCWSKLPNDRAYSDYAFDHVMDLMNRFQPDILWCDIGWPDAGKGEGRKSLVELFERFYEMSPAGVVNDRWGGTHWDFRTSEYEFGANVEGAQMWENTRGIGYSFGYNQLEDESTYLRCEGAIKHFVDVVSRGGNLLLNIGPKEDGTVPFLQAETLHGIGSWNRVHGSAIFGTRPVQSAIAAPTDVPWVRWTSSSQEIHAFIISATPEVDLKVDSCTVDLDSARCPDGSPVQVTRRGEQIIATLTQSQAPLPTRVTFRTRPI